MTIRFKPLTSLKPGHLFDMLVDSCSDLIEKYDWKNKDKYLESWRKMDSSSFENLETLGKYVLVSFVDNSSVGFFSWDPRNFLNTEL